MEFQHQAHNTHTCDIQLSCYITGCDVAQSHNHLARSAGARGRPLDPHLRTMNELGGGCGTKVKMVEGGRGCCIHDPDNNNHLLSAARGESETRQETKYGGVAVVRRRR